MQLQITGTEAAAVSEPKLSCMTYQRKHLGIRSYTHYVMKMHMPKDSSHVWYKSWPIYVTPYILPHSAMAQDPKIRGHHGSQLMTLMIYRRLMI